MMKLISEKPSPTPLCFEISSLPRLGPSCVGQVALMGPEGLLLQEHRLRDPQKKEEGWAQSPDPLWVGKCETPVACVCLDSDRYGPRVREPDVHAACHPAGP